MLWFKSPDGVTPSLLLFAYLSLAFPSALWGLSSTAWFVPSLLLMTNVLILSAYLLHDCLHNNVFASPSGNEKLGTLLAWLVGAVYSPYAMLREKHLRHHVERADILAVDYQALLEKHPLLDRCVRSATYAYFPAVDLLLQCLDVLAPIYIPQRRYLLWRTIGILALRTSLLAVLFVYSPLAGAGYLAAYLLFLWVVGFMDTSQHSYEIHYRLLGPQQKPERDRLYEESNTYTNLLSERFSLINLLVLNFCYHNVHHQRPNEPWYRLPGLYSKYYPLGCSQLVPLSTQLANFRRYRVVRIHHFDTEKTIGADGVSFLVGI